MRKKSPVAAVIDIGSNELRLHIAQTVPQPASVDKNQFAVQYLENLSYPMSLGRDTFHAGKLSFDKADKACEVIKNYMHVAKGYGVRNVRTVASTAMREATNADYIIDQIKIKTGVNVVVTDDLEEKGYIYKLLAHYADELLKKSAVIVYIGTGSIGVSLFVDGKMPRSWNIGTGSLRLSEMFGDLQEYTREFYRMMEKYLAGYTRHLSSDLPDGISHFIVSGQEVDVIAKLAMDHVPHFGEPLFQMTKEEFEQLYERIKRKSTGSIAIEYGLTPERAETLLPAVCIYKNLLDSTHAKTITASRLLPMDGVLFEMLHPKRFQTIGKRFDKGTTQSALEIMKRHNGSMEHGELVREFALMFFDKLRKLHGLEVRDKLLLIVAAYLHDIGKCVNVNDHNLTSYEMVRRSDIVGLTQIEKEIVALICRYHSGGGVDLGEYYYSALDSHTKVRVSKLTALLRLADALDRGNVEKFSRIDVKLSDTVLVVTVSTDVNIALEKWSFEMKGRFFAEVFGIKAELRVKRM